MRGTGNPGKQLARLGAVPRTLSGPSLYSDIRARLLAGLAMCRPWKASCKQRRGSMWSYRSGMDICGACAARSSKASPNIATSISAMLSVAAANGLHPVSRDAEVRVWCWTVEESKHFISHRQHHLHIAVIAWLDAVRKKLAISGVFRATGHLSISSLAGYAKNTA